LNTYLERSQCPAKQYLATDSEDKKQKDIHVEDALRACGYPERTFRKASGQVEFNAKKVKKTENMTFHLVPVSLMKASDRD